MSRKPTTPDFIAVTTSLAVAWGDALDRRGIDPASVSTASFDEIGDAAELGVRLFEHICSNCKKGLLVADERAWHPEFPKFMRGLNAAMRAWHEAAVKLSPVIARDVDPSSLPPEVHVFVRKAGAVGRALAEADSYGLRFEDFESEFKAFEDPSNERQLR